MTNEQTNFIHKIAEACMLLYPKYKILPSLTIAQAIKESNWGKSKLACNDYNFFGMKWSKTCGCDYAIYKTKEWDKINKCYVTIDARFRKYSSFRDGIEGYYKFISGYARYNNLIGELDPMTACINIQLDGWATAPDYGKSLYADYIFKYDLYKYDDIVLGRTSYNETFEQKTTEEVVHTVAKGDTLWRISSKYLGHGRYWHEIYDYNNLTTTVIKVGQKIKIPTERM